jgi:hypothetical protein
LFLDGAFDGINTGRFDPQVAMSTSSKRSMQLMKSFLTQISERSTISTALMRCLMMDRVTFMGKIYLACFLAGVAEAEELDGARTSIMF